jgi:hypothetical protein
MMLAFVPFRLFVSFLMRPEPACPRCGETFELPRYDGEVPEGDMQLYHEVLHFEQTHAKKTQKATITTLVSIVVVLVILALWLNLRRQ